MSGQDRARGLWARAEAQQSDIVAGQFRGLSLQEATGALRVVGVTGGMVVAGATTPSDNFTNPTNAIPTYSLLGAWDGATWDRVEITTTGELKVAEQFAPAAEDNTNGIIASIPRPLSVSTYCASVSTNQGAANSTSVKASAGNLFSLWVHNTNAATRYLFLCNLATAPVAATASLLCPIVVPAGAEVFVTESDLGQTGVNFTTGIGVAMMTTLAGGTLATAGECFWTVRYL